MSVGGFEVTQSGADSFSAEITVGFKACVHK